SRELKLDTTIEGLGEFRDFNPHERGEWPSAAGVYVFYDRSERPIYVGKSKNIAERLNDHVDKFWFRRPIVESASYAAIPEAKLRGQVETLLIKFMKSNAVLNIQNVQDRSSED
ncbi:protein containing Excinuclease ABC, C subunit, partial [mine drainage metagenome]